MSEPCNNPCQKIICAVPDDLATYNLQNPPPPVPNPIPTPFKNRQIILDNYCPLGKLPQTNGVIPDWLVIDTTANRIIVEAGVFSGATQEIADAIASAQPQQIFPTICGWFNQQQIVTCGDSSTRTIPANIFFSIVSQADADNRAIALGNSECANPACSGLDVGRYAILGYYDGIVLNAVGDALVGGEILWDGTFKYKSHANSDCYWGTNLLGTTLIINGREAHHANIWFHTGPYYWQLEIFYKVGANGFSLWQGKKLTGTSPAGIYTRSYGHDLIPATLTVIPISGTATVVAALP